MGPGRRVRALTPSELGQLISRKRKEGRVRGPQGRMPVREFVGVPVSLI